MDRVYGFLLMTLLLGLATVADLLAYITLGGDFYVIGLLILAVCLVFSILGHGTWLGRMFAMVVFGITLLSGMVLFPHLMEQKELFALLLIVGSLGFVLSLWESQGRKRKKPIAERPMPLPPEPMFTGTPALQSLAVMESLDKDDEFLELDEVDKLVQKKAKAPKRRTTKKKPRKKRTTRKRTTKRRP
jgi:hypothetical protein